MTEIRTIRPQESDAFLQVLCDIFGITFDRVRSVFYGEPFYDLNRKFAVFEDGQIVSILSSTPLEFGWGKAAGFAGVGTIEEARGRGYASRLLEFAIQEHRAAGERAAFLFAEDPRVYRSLGFKVLDEVVKALLESRVGAFEQILDIEDVESVYNQWAEQDLNRLKRDEKRWRYWKWNFRMCAQAGDGYVCQEGLLVREAIGLKDKSDWLTSERCSWMGLSSMQRTIEAPILKGEKTTHFMGIGVDEPPQLFLTDQW